MTALFRRPMGGAAVARHKRREPCDLQHEPGRGAQAQPPAKGGHDRCQLSGSRDEATTSRFALDEGELLAKSATVRGGGRPPGCGVAVCGLGLDEGNYYQWS